MKTQGITLMTAQATEVKVTKKSTKASDSTFDNFIANNASGVGRQTQTNQNATIADTKSSMESKSSKLQTSKKSEDGSSSNITQSKDANTQVNNQNTKDVKSSGNDKSANVDTADASKVDASQKPMVDEDGQVDIDRVNEEIMSILQDILNLLPQDVQDIFDEMGMQPSDLITGLQTGEIESFSITTVQVFVMEVHGIEDPSAFLTNDLLNQEMNDIFDRMKSLLSELMRVGVEDIDKLEESVWQSFAGNLIQAAHPEDTVETTDEENVPIIETDVQETTEDGTPDMSVIIENQTSDQAGSGNGQSTDQGTGLGADDVRDAAADLQAMGHHTQTSNAEAFADALTEALEPEATQYVDTQRQMTEMVEQVVRQVRIRMMPESTNMEIQLHPASLGRVSVQIAAAGQETTARLIVENQAAKEALESGMIRLQEAFEERGLKVQEVEVAVGNFDLNMSQQAGQDAESGSAGRGGRRNGGNQADGAEGVSTAERGETEQSRRDVNSTVDYTA